MSNTKPLSMHVKHQTLNAEHQAPETRETPKYTPLHLAVLNERNRTVDWLIAYNADIEVRDKMQNTPLHLACITGNIRTVKALCDAGADVGARDASEWTPFFKAVFYKADWEVLDVLLEVSYQRAE